MQRSLFPRSCSRRRSACVVSPISLGLRAERFVWSDGPPALGPQTSSSAPLTSYVYLTITRRRCPPVLVVARGMARAPLVSLMKLDHFYCFSVGPTFVAC